MTRQLLLRGYHENQHEILLKIPLGRLLVNRGLITDSELDFALSRLPGTGQTAR